MQIEEESELRVRLLRKLFDPSVDFLEQVYIEYLKQDCVLHVELMSEDAVVPTRAHEHDAGMDVYASMGATILPGDIVMVSTGLKVAIPTGWQLSVRPRSGLSLKHLTVVNSPGTIDSKRGEFQWLA